MRGAKRRPITRRHDGVFARNLHDLIVSHDMTYSIMAKDFGCRPTTVERMLNLGALPGGVLLMRICDYFDVPLEILRHSLEELDA